MPLRTAGLVLYTVGLTMAITGRAQLGNSWSDIEAPGQVAKPALISQGLYGYIRHPIYTGDILLLIGLELALNSKLVFAILLMVPVILIQAIREERLLAQICPDIAITASVPNAFCLHRLERDSRLKRTVATWKRCTSLPVHIPSA